MRELFIMREPSGWLTFGLAAAWLGMGWVVGHVWPMLF